METTTVLETTIIANPKKFILFVIVFLVGGLGLTFYLYFLTRSVFILVSGLVFFYGFPAVFPKKFRRWFTQTAVVSFTADYFMVEFRSLSTYEVLRTDTNQFNQIRQFVASGPGKNDFSILTLFFKDGTKIKYTFSGQQGNALNEKNINGVIKKAFEMYNVSKPPQEKITIATSFITGKASLYVIIGVIVLMVVALVYVFIKSPGAVPVLVIFFFFTSYVLMLERNKAIEEKDKFI